MYKIVAGSNGLKATIAPGVETHPQFASDAPWGNTDVQLIASRPITDNSRVLHHWILYANTGTRAHIKGWAPGADNTQYKPLPSDVGIFLPKGTGSLRLDTHYYNVNGTKMEEDASGIELCVAKNLRKPPRPSAASQRSPTFRRTPRSIPSERARSVRGSRSSSSPRARMHTPSRRT